IGHNYNDIIADDLLNEPQPLVAEITKYDCNETQFHDESDDISFLDGNRICLLNTVVNNSFIGYFHIQTASDNDYLISTVEFCAPVDHKLIVVDANSGNVLSSFTGKQTDGECQLNSSQTFISDSNKIRIEFTAFDSNQATTHSLGNKREVIFTDSDGQPFFQFSVTHKKAEFRSTEIHAEMDSDSRFKVQIDHYLPNSVWTLVVPKAEESETEYKIGVQFEIIHLDLDFDKNDYLIICPGMQPKLWAHTKCQIITRKIVSHDNGGMKFWINADSAFLRIVTHNSLKANAYGQIANKTIRKSKNDDIANRIKLASTQLCFEQLCINWQTMTQKEFLQQYVYHLNNYLVEHESNISMLIDTESVRIIDMRNESISSSRYNVVCRVSLAVTSPYDPEYPLVDGDTLHEMYFGGRTSLMFNGIRVTDCSYMNITLLEIIIPILVIILVFSIITVIFWRLQAQLIKNRYTQIKRNGKN
ncbi:hypothetical protein BLA29_004317, partial [Euroglyphus maynei]